MTSAVRNAPRGLSPQDLTAIRDSLATGRKPKVTFTETAGQIAGQTGQVVELTDPALSDEWVVVRFGKDELPFAPADLAIPSRVPSARRGEAKAQPAPPPPELKIVREKPTPRQEKTVPAASTVESPASPAQPAAQPASPPASPPASAAASTAAEAKPRKTAKVKPPATLTVTLAYADGEWTVAAQQGAKALAKPYQIRPSDALKMVGLLDVPGVHEAVEQIMSAERADAEHQAERLRAELAEIEAKLAELRVVN